MTEPQRVVIRRAADVLWEEPPGHFKGANSKMMVRPESCRSTLLDYRISLYQPGGFVKPHRHKRQEQIYHILEGEGLLDIEGRQQVVGPESVVFIPPGVEHAIYNTGLVDLRFIVVTALPDDEEGPS